MCRAGGIVAVRDADYGAMTWWPDDPGLDAWMDLYQRVARAAGTESDAGRRLLGWAKRPVSTICGFRLGLVVCVAGGSPVVGAVCGRKEPWNRTSPAWPAIRTGDAELTAISNAWSRWSEAEDGWFVIVHGRSSAGSVRSLRQTKWQTGLRGQGRNRGRRRRQMIRITSPDRVVLPRQGWTKMDVVGTSWPWPRSPQRNRRPPHDAEALHDQCGRTRSIKSEHRRTLPSTRCRSGSRSQRRVA